MKSRARIRARNDPSHKQQIQFQIKVRLLAKFQVETKVRSVQCWKSRHIFINRQLRSLLRLHTTKAGELQLCPTKNTVIVDDENVDCRTPNVREFIKHNTCKHSVPQQDPQSEHTRTIESTESGASQFHNLCRDNFALLRTRL